MVPPAHIANVVVPLVLGGTVCLLAAGLGLAAMRRYVAGGWRRGEGEAVGGMFHMLRKA